MLILIQIGLHMKVATRAPFLRVGENWRARQCPNKGLFMIGLISYSTSEH